MAVNLVITDIHFGKKNDSEEHNKNCLDFIKWVHGVAKDCAVDRVSFLGDWHDSRSKIGVETINYSAQAFEVLNEIGLPISVVVGNHDMPYRDSRKFHSLPWAPKYENITIVDEPVIIGGSSYVPYIVHGDDRSKIAAMAMQTEFVFGHFEFPGFLMNGSYEMPKKKDSLLIDDISGPRYVFSGHFHARQEKIGKSGTIFQYIGNCFPHDFSDAGDEDRGLMLIEDGKKPVYMKWPAAPSYHKIAVSELGDALPKLGRNASVRAIPDVDLSKADRDGIIEEIRASYDLKGFSIEPVAIEQTQSAAKWDAGADLDSFVVSWIMDEVNQIEPGMDRQTLASMYTEAMP